MNTKTQPAASEPSSGEREGIAEMIREAHDLSLDEMHRAAREKMLEAAALLSSDARTAGQAEPVLGTKTWFDGEKVITQYLTASDIYKDQPAPQAVPQAEAVRVQHVWNPTDEELKTIYKKANGEDAGKARPLTTQRIFTAMRAMIAVAQKPQESHRAEQWTSDQIEAVSKSEAPPLVFNKIKPMASSLLDYGQYGKVVEINHQPVMDDRPKRLISTDGCDGNHGGPACASPGCWHRD